MTTKTSHGQPSAKFGIHSLDVLGDKFKIGFPTITGRTQSTLGGILTILMSLTSMSIFVLIMSQYFLKEAPIVMTSSEFGSQIASFQLYDENLYFPFAFAKGSNFVKATEMKRFLTVKIIVVEAAFNPSNQRFDITPFREFDFIPCTETKDPNVLDVLYKVVSLPEFVELNICPDFQGQEQDFEVFDNYENYTHKWVSIKVYPCTLPDPSQCASAEELKGLRVDYGFPFKLLETSDSDNPV